jgi:hypothetical protein
MTVNEHQKWQAKFPLYGIEYEYHGSWDSETNKWTPHPGWEVGTTRNIEGFDVTLLDYSGYHEEGNNHTEYHVVVEVEGTYWKINGDFYSHCGLEWENWHRVTPKKEVVIRYE